MSQVVVNENQKISYTNLDFSSIYTETLDLIKKLTYKWDPSISDESDPGVILVKLSALIADKCNYNIDKSILEAFPLSVTQDSNARQLYSQLGYYMDWYESAIVPISLSWVGDTTDTSLSYTIPKFTPICNSDSTMIYTLVGVEGNDSDLVVSNMQVGTDGKIITAYALEGTPVQYQYINGESVITAQMVDPNSRRLYFASGSKGGQYIPQNGIFVKNTNQENYADWKRVNNLYEQNFNELRYVFGYDSAADACYLEFPDNYAELFGSGIEITYLILQSTDQSAKIQELTQFVSSFNPPESTEIVIDSNTVKLINYYAASGHKDKEDIDQAYINYRRTVGTFSTLVTLRDYLNFIRDNDLCLCSNAFVCDRTNDIQTVYKIISKQNNLDTILVKVEQIVDKTALESTFTFKFIKTADTIAVTGKNYYTISSNNELEKVTTIETGANPQALGWYEKESIVPSSKNALDAFSIKFYMLKNAVALNTKTAYAETFDMMYNSADIDTLLSDKAHLEHTYENILPYGENIYKPATDRGSQTWNYNKSYFSYDSENERYILLDPETYASEVPASAFQIDIEAMLPHVCYFKNIYPVSMNISTYQTWDATTQSEILANVISALYQNTNSNQMEFGENPSLDYLTEIVKNSDERIKYVTFETLSYQTQAIYYDKYTNKFVSIDLDSDMSFLHPANYANELALKVAQIKKDIVTRSILAGYSQLLVPDTTFEYHLNQDYVDYITNVSNITSQATIDIREASATTYAVTDTGSTIKKVYTLKDNEMLTLYRPELQKVQTFTSGVHYECVLFNDIQADESYELSRGEYIIFYTPIQDESENVTGYTAYAYTSALGKVETLDSGNETMLHSAIIHPSFKLSKQQTSDVISNFARTRILPYFEVNMSEYSYETSTYNSTYMTEIRNNTTIASNAISGTNSVTIELLQSLDLYTSDKYKFYWVLNNAKYSSEDNLKTYTLFNEFNSLEDNYSTNNSYTLKSGEYFYYTDKDETSLAIIGPGTTLIRNCGVDSSEYVSIKNSIYYAYYNNLIQEQGVNLQIITDANGNPSPGANGFYTAVGNAHITSSDTNPYAEGLYERSATTPYVYTLSTHTAPILPTYYEVTFTRVPENTAYDPSAIYYVLLMHKKDGWYISYKYTEGGEQKIGYTIDNVTNSTFSLQDIYKVPELGETLPLINPAAEDYYETINNAGIDLLDTYSFDRTDDKSIPNANHQRFAKIYSTDNEITTRALFSENANYRNIEIDEISTYSNINLSTLSGTNPKQLGLLTPVYKTYYNGSTPITSDSINLLDNPKKNGWSDSAGGSITADEHPAITHVKRSTDVSFFTLEHSGETVTADSYSTWGYQNYNFYRPNSGDMIYRYVKSDRTIPYLNTASTEDATDSTLLLNRLYSIYDKNRPVSYPSATDKIIINNIKNNYWQAYWSFNTPDTWATCAFKEAESATPGDYVRLTIDQVATAAINLGSIYPDLASLDSSVKTEGARFYVEKTKATNAGISVGNTTYNKVNNSFILLDLDYKLFNLFAQTDPNINITQILNKCSVQLYYMPRIYKFTDIVAYTNKKYYLPTKYYQKDCGLIDAWTCYALDNDDLYEDPMTAIQQKYWRTLQTNTSLTIVQNNTEWSFSAGDKVIFEAPESTESEVNWPVFTNDETVLDLDEYAISYQRKNSSIESLPALAIESYKWRGYSSLLLNTSSKNGQTLASNHNIIIYSNGEEIEVSGAHTGVAFQLKYPISNVAGNFINVATVSATTKDAINNEVYIFKTLPNVENRYIYTNDNYETYLYFNKTSTDYASNLVKLPMSKLNGKYILPLTLKDLTSISAQYSQHYTFTSETVQKHINLAWQASPTDTPRGGTMLWEGKVVDLYSYVDEARTSFTGSGQDYLCLNIDNIEKDFIKVKLPSSVTSDANLSPKELGWYYIDLATGSFTPAERAQDENTGAALLTAVDAGDIGEKTNPKANGWYVQVDANYHLTTDTSAVAGRRYYKEPDYYVPAKLVTSEITFMIPAAYTDPITYVLSDIYKYNNNPLLGTDFDLVRQKIKQLDTEEQYNYAYIPSSNDLIPNPLLPKSFWDVNHIFNPFTIAQLDFDTIEENTRFITVK